MAYASYKNGNYVVYRLGSVSLVKRVLRVNEDLCPEFPDSIDLKISNRCSTGCPYCHEKSESNGQLANLEELKKHFIDVKDPIEIAIGGGNLLEDDESRDLLKSTVSWLIQEKKYNVNLTLNENMITSENLDFLTKDLISNPKKSKYSLISGDLGLGISLGPNSTIDSVQAICKLLNDRKYGTNDGKDTLNLIPVFHIILGLISLDLLKWIIYKAPGEILSFSDKPTRTLFLGYKQFGRAEGTKLPKTLPDFTAHIKTAILKNRSNSEFAGNIVFGFDNLAIEQLNLEAALLSDEFRDVYLGPEFSCSMYVDAVKGEFAKTSRSKERVSWNETSILEFFRHDKIKE